MTSRPLAISRRQPVQAAPSLKNKTRESVNRFVEDGRNFLRLPLFLDAASSIVAGGLEACDTEIDFLRKSRAQRRVSWPNETDLLAKYVSHFVSVSSLEFLSNPRARALLALEWTGAWLKLITGAMCQREVRDLMNDLLSQLLDDEANRWDPSRQPSRCRML